jgi:hypothetical protein
VTSAPDAQIGAAIGFTELACAADQIGGSARVIPDRRYHLQ